MTFSPEQIAALSAKLDAKHVKARKQAGRSLSYVEGWHVIAEANRIFGFDGWTRETVDIRCVAEKARKIGRDDNQRDGWGVTYVCRVRVTVGSIVREGTGAGHGIDVDLGAAHESAIKEAETDAMKRGFMTFGWPFGLALYDKDQEHVEEPCRASKPVKAPAPKPEAERGLTLRFPDKTAAVYQDERAWFADLERYTMEDTSMWNLNVDTARKLAKESDEWKAWGKKIAGMLAPMAG